jgi:ATP-dependent helicase/nuclease subunit B
VPVQFVIGRAGSGKTHRCLTSIVDAMRADPLGPPIYWIVPKQATFMTERALTVAAGAFCRTRVVSFDQLGKEIFAHAGGNVIPEVTPLGRQMVIGHLLRQLKPQLRFFASSAHQPGLAAELDATFATFERAGKNSSDFTTLIDDLETTRSHDVNAAPLLAKLRDLRLIYDAYLKYLGQDRLDQHQRLQQVLSCLDTCLPLRGATVYVDGFTEFTAHERRLLGGLAKVATRMEIALLMDPTSEMLGDPHILPDDANLFRQTKETYRRLWFTFSESEAEIEEPLRLEANHRTSTPALRAIDAAMFSNTNDATHHREQSPVGQAFLPASRGSTPPRESLQCTNRSRPTATDGRQECLPHEQAAPDDGVEMTVLHDRQAEVDAAARGIRKLWREGVRLREIAVLVRDIEPYHTLIDASFREHGIAYFADRRRSATHHPLLQFVRSLLRIVRFDWPNEDVFTLIKSGLSGLTPSEGDTVENYVNLHRIHGPAWAQAAAWSYRRSTTRADADDVIAIATPTEADRLRRRITSPLIGTIATLRTPETLTVRAIATELFAVLDRFAIRETLANWSQAASENDPEQAAEHEQVWAEFVALCEQMVDLLGEETVTLNDFTDILESGLERFDLAITPPTVDEVLVGQVDRTRCPDVKATFVLGLNEGEFPRIAREPSILTDSDRRELRRRHVDLGADRRQQIADEDLLGYIAMTRPSQRLFVSRTRTDDSGKPANPSRYWQRLSALFPQSMPAELLRDTSHDTRFIDTPRQLIVALLRWARSPELLDDATLSSLYQWLAIEAGRDEDDNEVTHVRQLAWPAIGYTNDASLTPQVAAQLFGGVSETSSRQLETFAACPFKHFVRYGLGLSSREAPGVTGLDLSQVYHRVLDIVVGEMIEKRADWQNLNGVITPQAISQYAQAVGQTLRDELMLSNARNKYLLGRVERTLGEIIATQTEMMRRGQFRPVSTAASFGAGKKMSALRVTSPGGKQVAVAGSIDRIDVLPGSGHAVVFDYKLAAGPLALQEVYHGLSLQLLTYLLALQANGEKLAGKPITPVAAFYLPLMRRLTDVDHPKEAPDPKDPEFHLRVKPRGVFREDCTDTLDSQFDRGWSDVLAAFKNKDGQLGNRGKSDVAGTEEFGMLLAHVKRRIGELVDEMVTGNVSVTPYRLNGITPCPRCDYRSVCRFEPSINRYRTLQPMRREDVFSELAEHHGDAHGE